ncbi:hypothetical protein SANT12839_090460 [Streptomyces antimycoticus]|uniref:Peptidase M20 dimerisation domain-containing protein n=1 Tax=Streptomyces antimycoticus TaxID=68175 RepID=A0A4D4KJ08_9ACTN|nr:hypothetical protein [Streptomyces antimycoticus]GDY48164.1 hypothetical protein SANT12839_090460 [Streptomyces antimycoticus]
MTADGLAGLDDRRRSWVLDAARHISTDRLRELITGLVNIPSPTGDEGPLATHIADTLRTAGCHAAVQPLDDRQANAWGRLTGDGTGPDLMLYAPSTPSRWARRARTCRGSARSCARTCAPRPPSTTTWSPGSAPPTPRATRRA